jgi:hypothetical protein
MYRPTRVYQAPYIAPQTYERYYVNQVGSGMPVYRGSTNLQRGHGLGGIFSSLFRSALPLLKQGAKAVGRQALQTGVDIAQDVMSGQSVKSAAKSRLKTAGRNMGTKVLNKIQKGKVASTTSRKRGKKRSRVKQTLIPRPNKRRKQTRKDIFG